MPNITLTFNNPLNTSVQIGDTAYFSNPYPVGGVGSPTGGQWASTVTPHLTNNISEVISLGEITGVKVDTQDMGSIATTASSGLGYNDENYGY